MKKTFIALEIIVAITLTTCSIWQMFISINNSNGVQMPLTNTLVPKVTFVDRQLSSMSLRQKVSSLLILHTSGTNTASLINYIQTYQPGGLIFMSDNIPSTIDELTKTTDQLQTKPGLPYLLAIDEEGGIVRRLANDTYPAAIELGPQLSSATESAFRERSILLKKAGMNLNFGIIADITSNSMSFIYPRVFSGNPAIASSHVAAAVAGAKGLTLSTLKHFPGHGETASDSHFTIPTTDVSYNNWRQHDNLPFTSGIKAGAQVVMFGHLIYSSVDKLPASLSAKWHQIIATEDSFSGISITDDMIMLQQSGDINYADPVVNAINAIKAGNTMLLYVLDHGNSMTNIDPNNLINGIVSAVNDGRLNKTTVETNARRVLTLRHNLKNILTNN